MDIFEKLNLQDDIQKHLNTSPIHVPEAILRGQITLGEFMEYMGKLPATRVRMCDYIHLCEMMVHVLHMNVLMSGVTRDEEKK